MATASTPNDDALAVAIIRAWKSDAALRAEFGTIAIYSAYAQAERGGRMRVPAATSAPSGLPEPAKMVPACTPAVAVSQAHALAAPIKSVATAQVQPLRAVPIQIAASKPAKAMTTSEAGAWLSNRFKAHVGQYQASGMSHAAACIEARRLCRIDQQGLRGEPSRTA